VVTRGGLFLGVIHAPTSSGRGPIAPQFREFLSSYAYIYPLSQNYHLSSRGGIYPYVSQAAHPKKAEFHGSPILEVLLHLCLHPLTQNDQIRHGEGMF